MGEGPEGCVLKGVMITAQETELNNHSDLEFVCELLLGLRCGFSMRYK